MCAKKPAVLTGMTFGAFDLCHQGQINFLKQARELCDKLIVCVSSDGYIENTKGCLPLLRFHDRCYLIEQTGLADIVEMQPVCGKKHLVEMYKPDVLFVGTDWNPETYGGEGLCEVHYLPYTVGLSTSWYRDKLTL